jgi:hypothetical protein
MGQFAQLSLPLADSATLTIQRVNSSKVETVTIPYRSRIGATTIPFTNSTSFRANNCRAVAGTNGADVYDGAAEDDTHLDGLASHPPIRFAQMAKVSKKDLRRHAINVALDTAPPSDVVLPPGLAPPAGLNGSASVAQFYMLPDNKTGVLALGSFSGADFATLQNSTLAGLQNLLSLGAKQLSEFCFLRE